MGKLILCSGHCCTNSILAVEYASCRENLKELLNHKQSQYEEG